MLLCELPKSMLTMVPQHALQWDECYRGGARNAIVRQAILVRIDQCMTFRPRLATEE